MGTIILVLQDKFKYVIIFTIMRAGYIVFLLILITITSCGKRGKLIPENELLENMWEKN